jgi:hypothetical protein
MTSVDAAKTSKATSATEENMRSVEAIALEL